MSARAREDRQCKCVVSASGQKVLTTMKTVPSNMVTVNKNPPNKQQTIVITKPQGAGRPPTQQIIVVTTASGLRTVQAITTSQAGQGNRARLSGFI